MFLLPPVVEDTESQYVACNLRWPIKASLQDWRVRRRWKSLKSSQCWLMWNLLDKEGFDWCYSFSGVVGRGLKPFRNMLPVWGRGPSSPLAPCSATFLPSSYTDSLVQPLTNTWLQEGAFFSDSGSYTSSHSSSSEWVSSLSLNLKRHGIGCFKKNFLKFLSYSLDEMISVISSISSFFFFLNIVMISTSHLKI